MGTDPDRGERNRLARRVLAVLSAVAFASLVAFAVNLPEDYAWQHLVALAGGVGLLAACVVALRWARADQPERAMQLAYVALFAVILVVDCMHEQQTGLLGTSVALFILLTAPRILSPANVDRWVNFGALAALGLTALELLPLPIRVPPALEGPRDIFVFGALTGIAFFSLREFPRFRLASKLTLGALLITLVPLIAASIDSQRRLAAVDADLALKDMSYRTSNGAATWDATLTRVVEPMRRLVESGVCDAARGPGGEVPLQELLASTRAPTLSSAGVWDVEGRPLLAAGAPFPGGAAPAAGFTVAVDASGADRVIVAVPGPTCTLAAAVRPGLLRDWSAAAASELRGAVVFRDGAGQVLHGNAAPGVAEALPSAPVAERETSAALPDLPLAAARAVTTARLDGGHGLAAVARIPVAGWTLALVHDEAALLALADVHARQMKWITLLVAALACLGAFLLSRRIARPIAQLAAAMTRFTEGDADARAPIGDGEIGELARRFDQMAEQVGGLVRSLEQQTKRLQTEIGERSGQEQRLQSLNAELTVAHDKAQAASRAKSTFLAHMSHELRTPLNAIIGYGEMLFDQASVDGRVEIARDAGNIVQSAQHLLEIINDILDLSKIEAGKMDMVLEEFDAARIAREVGESVRPIVANNRNHLFVRIDQEPARMYSDRLKLRQALLNLLSNAAKFTEGGEVVLSVEHRQVTGLACLVFTVRDTGVGIPEDALETLFDPFTQVAYPSVRKQSGTGLGLAITRRLCRLMGGEIEVSSTVGSGSTFTMTVPMTYKGNRESGSWRPLRVFRKHEETGRGKFF